MSRVAVVAEADRAEPWALAGALVVPVEGGDIAAAWSDLPTDVVVVVVTAEVAATVGRAVGDRLVVVLP